MAFFCARRGSVVEAVGPVLRGRPEPVFNWLGSTGINSAPDQLAMPVSAEAQADLRSDFEASRMPCHMAPGAARLADIIIFVAGVQTFTSETGSPVMLALGSS